MPPFQTPQPNGHTTPPNPHHPPTGGMDQQTKNVMLFAIIFSVLAAGVILAFLFRNTLFSSESDVPQAESTRSENYATSSSETDSSTNPAAPASNTVSTEPITTTPPAESSGGFFTSLLKSFFQPTIRVPSISVATQNKGGSATGGSSAAGGKSSQPYVSTSTPPAPNTEPTAEEQQTAYLKMLEGIYGETKATDAQLKVIQLTLISSPLRGKLWISGVVRSTDANKEYITIATSKDLQKETTITGMTVKSVESGQVAQIGEGVNTFISNSANTPSEIKIYPNQKVLVTTGRSPLGYSFRLNKCTGYFSQFQTFAPALPQICPRLKNEAQPQAPNRLPDACLDYIDSFATCKIITELPKTVTDKLNSEEEYRCLTFIQKNTGYQNCTDLHKYDSDFYGTEWRTYLNHSNPIWKKSRETIWLLDQSGRFISQYSY